MPEGVGATDVRNKFNKFHTGFMRMIKGHPVPIIPIGFYGVDESIPWFVSHNKFLVEKFMKPVDPTFDFFLLPKLPIIRPTKIVFKVGTPIMLDPKDLSTEEKIQSKTKEVQSIIEGLVHDAESLREEKINANPLNKIYHKVFQGNVTYF